MATIDSANAVVDLAPKLEKVTPKMENVSLALATPGPYVLIVLLMRYDFNDVDREARHPHRRRETIPGTMGEG